MREVDKEYYYKKWRNYNIEYLKRDTYYYPTGEIANYCIGFAKYCNKSKSSFMEKILVYLKKVFCSHPEFDCDNQIRVIECVKCGRKSWIRDYKNIYDVKNK